MSERVTLFQCGSVRNCEHDYSGWKDILDENGKVIGGTTVCTKCGQTAYEEAQWL